MRDDLTPKQRKKAIREGRPYDRLPNLFTMEDVVSKVTGIKVSEFHLDPKLALEANIAAWERFEPDVVETLAGPEGLFANEMVFPDYSTPYIKDAVDPSREFIEDLSLGDPKTTPVLAGFWSSLDALQETFEEKAEIGVLMAGPVTAAARIIGVQKFLKLLIRDPGYIHLLLDKVTQLKVETILATAGRGIFYDIKDPVSSGSLIRHKDYLAFAKPYQKRLFDAMNESNPGEDHILHICGDSSRLWEDMVDTGASVISIDNAMDLKEAKERIGHLASVSGNVKPTDSMLLGTPEDVEADYKQGLKKSWDAEKPYIADFGCGLPLNTPLENLDTIFAVHRKYAQASSLNEESMSQL